MNKQTKPQNNDQPILLGVRLTATALLLVYTILFFLSGAAGLVYQVVWQRILQVYFGVTTYSIAVIVAAYMCGLGIGSLGGGWLSQRLRRPLTAFAGMQLGIGLFALISPHIILSVGRATAGSSYAVVFGLSFALLLIPTMLMGATLPLLARAFIHRLESAGKIIGLLYGINTLGAAIGSLAAGFVLIGWLGLAGSIQVAVAINLFVCIAALLTSSNQVQEKSLPPTVGKIPARKTLAGGWGYRTVLSMAFLTGFLGLAYEMLWIRALGVINKHTVYLFPSVLFAVLLGLAIGGYIFGRLADRSPNPLRLFCVIEILVGVFAALGVVVLLNLPNLPAMAELFYARFAEFQQPPSPFVWLGDQYVFSRVRMTTGLLVVLLPPALLALPASLLMGGGLPILDRIAIESPQMAGKRVGDVHLANIIGSTLGTLTVSLVLLPAVGTEVTLKILVLLAFVFLFLGFGDTLQNKTKSDKKTALVLAAALLLMVVLLPRRTEFYQRIYTAGTRSPVVIDEGRDSVLALTGFNPDGEKPTWFWIGGEINSFFPPDGSYESVALPCAAASAPRRVLVIGFGGGHTTRFFTEIPGVEEIVVIELLENIAPMLEDHLEHVQQILNDRRVSYVVDDGRRFLYANPHQNFNVIIMDPYRNYTAGSNSLYAAEAMALYRSRLTEGGVVCVWKDEGHIIPATAASVFPYVDDYRYFMIASDQPIFYNFEALQAYDQILREEGAPTIQAHQIDPYNIISRYLRDQDRIRRESERLPILSDLNPYLEYYYFNQPTLDIPVIRDASPDNLINRLQGCDDACRQHIRDDW